MTDEQCRLISEFPNFLRGEHYDPVTVLYFSARNDDMKVRAILDPLMFLFQDRIDNTQFRINFNPTEDQHPMLRRFMELAQGKLLAQLPFTPMQVRLPGPTV